MNEIPDPHDKSLSRTQRKLAAQALQQLGSDIAGLPTTVFNALPIDKTLRKEFEHLRKIKSHVARKRQMLYVAKLLRREDPEPLFAALDKYQQQGREQTARQHRVEQWREYLLKHGDTALSELVDARPQIDRQTVRQLMRQTQAEIARQKPPTASRKLFRLLHKADLLENLPNVPLLPEPSPESS